VGIKPPSNKAIWALALGGRDLNTATSSSALRLLLGASPPHSFQEDTRLN